MRTAADLDGAFALLERLAAAAVPDASVERATPTRAPVLDLVAPVSRRPAHRRRAVAMLATAAAVAAALALAVPWRGGGSPGDGFGASAQDRRPATRSLGFTIDPSLGMTAVSVSAPGGQDPTVELVDSTQKVDVWVSPEDAGTRVTPGLTPVDVNGSTGFYSDGQQSPFLEPPPDLSTEPPGWTPSKDYGHIVVWEYAAHAWASVVFQGSVPTEDELLRVARAVRFGDGQPIRSAVSMTAAPDGMQLTRIEPIYYEVDDPPYATAGTGWDTMLTYDDIDAGTREVVVEATSADVTRDWTAGEPMTVGGRPACWFASRQALDVDAGNGAYLVLSGEGVSRDKLVAAAGSVTVTPHPEDRASWFDARTALP